jgi:hypothetical protein
MYAAAIIFLVLAWIFGRHVFRVVRWLVFGSVFALIGLFVLAQVLPLPEPKPTAAEAAPTPRPDYGFVKEVVEPSPTPKVLTAQEESQLLDYGFDDGSSPEVHKTKHHKRSHM